MCVCVYVCGSLVRLHLYVCACTCVSTCSFVFMCAQCFVYVFIYAYLCACILHMCAFVSLCQCLPGVFTYTCAHLSGRCVSVCTSVSVYTCRHTWLWVHKHACVNVYMCTDVCVKVRECMWCLGFRVCMCAHTGVEEAVLCEAVRRLFLAAESGPRAPRPGSESCVSYSDPLSLHNLICELGSSSWKLPLGFTVRSKRATLCELIRQDRAQRLCCLLGCGYCC